MQLLAQFLFRLAFGMALAMGATSPRQVTSGYFRVHLYVVLGLCTLAAMVALAVPEYSLWPPVAGAVLSYIGSVMWLYEKPAAGRTLLLLVAGVTLFGAWQAQSASLGLPLAGQVLVWLDPLAGGLVLGTTMAAMLLGHWYLNTPTMHLAPLRRLLKLMALAVLLRMVLSAVGLTLELTHGAEPLSTQLGLFIVLRWLAGLVTTLGLVWMTWQTLKIPNTQSATGILYVCVITTFLGELTAQLLSAELTYPI